MRDETFEKRCFLFQVKSPLYLAVTSKSSRKKKVLVSYLHLLTLLLKRLRTVAMMAEILVR